MSASRSPQHGDLIQQYFDQHAQSWQDYYESGKTLIHVILIDRKEIALRYLRTHLAQGGSVLDAGCGAGLLALDAVRAGYTVHGWDIAQEMIELSEATFAQEAIDRASYTFSTGDVLQAGLPDGSFDGILAIGFLQYQPDEAQALREFNRLLKPGGILVISGPIKRRFSNYFGLSDWLEHVRFGGRRLAPGHELLNTISPNSYSIGRFRKLLSAANFTVLDYRGHGYAHFDYLSKRLSPRRKQQLHRGLTRLSQRIKLLQWFGNDIVVAARKQGSA